MSAAWLLLTVPAHAASTPADPLSENAFVSAANYERGTHAIEAVGNAADLVAVARRHSKDMASRGQLFHNPTLASDVQNWQAVGENVGQGGSVRSVEQALMNSPHHRDIILGAAYTDVGVGVVWSGGALWVTELFRQPPSGGSAPVVTRAPASQSPPRPEARPAPAARPASSRPAPDHVAVVVAATAPATTVVVARGLAAAPLLDRGVRVLAATGRAVTRSMLVGPAASAILLLVLVMVAALRLRGSTYDLRLGLHPRAAV